MMKTKNQNGFSLLELMIALAILAVGILAVASMQISAKQGNADAMKFTDISTALQAQIEVFINAGYTTIDNTGATTPDGYTELTNANLDSIPADYTLEYRVISTSDLDSNGTDDFMEIHLRVRLNSDVAGRYRTELTFYKNRG